MIEKHCFFIDAKSYKLIQSIYKLKGFKSPSALVNQAISDWFARDAGRMSRDIYAKNSTMNSMQ